MKICTQIKNLILQAGFYKLIKMIRKRKSKPKKKNIELLNKFLKIKKVKNELGKNI